MCRNMPGTKNPYWPESMPHPCFEREERTQLTFKGVRLGQSKKLFCKVGICMPLVAWSQPQEM